VCAAIASRWGWLRERRTRNISFEHISRESAVVPAEDRNPIRAHIYVRQRVDVAPPAARSIESVLASVART
jgi:hypothetical protein